MKVVSSGTTNAKTKKLAKELGIVSGILYLSPANESGHNTCPMATAGCAAACLYTAGYAGVYKTVNEARMAKTARFFEDHNAFMADLVADIKALRRKAAKEGKQAVMRLNGTSDLLWERIGATVDGTKYANLMVAFPDVTFYDYTKVITRLRKPLPTNYHLTFSLSENNDIHAAEALRLGFNVAAVIRNPGETFAGWGVIDGDEHDFRFLDKRSPDGYIVALKAKGKAKGDTSGFVRDGDTADLDFSRKFVPHTLALRVAA